MDSSHRMVHSSRHHLGGNPMSTLWVFFVRFGRLIVCAHCFDRVIFRAILPCRLYPNSSTSSIASESSSEPFHEGDGPPVLRPLRRACPGLGAGRLVEFTCIAAASFVRRVGTRT